MLPFGNFLQVWGIERNTKEKIQFNAVHHRHGWLERTVVHNLKKVFGLSNWHVSSAVSFSFFVFEFIIFVAVGRRCFLSVATGGAYHVASRTTASGRESKANKPNASNRSFPIFFPLRLLYFQLLYCYFKESKGGWTVGTSLVES